MQASIEVRQTPPEGDAGVSIDDGSSFTYSKRVGLNLVWPSYATQAKVSNDGGFAASRTKTFDVESMIAWDLNDTVSGRFPKVVYVRFLGSGVDGTRTFQDDILLDSTAPIISSSSGAASSSSNGVSAQSVSDVATARKVAKTRAFKIAVRARDNMSGVSDVQINTRARSRSAKLVSFSRTIAIRTSARSV